MKALRRVRRFLSLVTWVPQRQWTTRTSWYGELFFEITQPLRILQVLIWTLWAISLLLTALRGLTRWHSQRQIFADDHFVFFGLLSLTGLTAVITRLLPQFYLSGTYTAAVMQDPTTPMPLPPDIFIQRTQTSLKLMFSQMLLFWTTLWAGMLTDPDSRLYRTSS